MTSREELLDYQLGKDFILRDLIEKKTITIKLANGEYRKVSFEFGSVILGFYLDFNDENSIGYFKPSVSISVNDATCTNKLNNVFELFYLSVPGRSSVIMGRRSCDMFGKWMNKVDDNIFVTEFCNDVLETYHVYSMNEIKTRIERI